jgi:hypothetical protein
MHVLFLILVCYLELATWTSNKITCVVGVSFQSMRTIARFGADSKPAEDVTNLTPYRMLAAVRCREENGLQLFIHVNFWKWRILKIIVIQYDDHMSWEQPENEVICIINLQGCPIWLFDTVSVWKNNTTSLLKLFFLLAN